MRALKIAAFALAGIVVLLIVGAIALVSVFDPNDYKSYAATFVAERTGRTLEIRDDLELSVFPWLAIETGGVTLGNAEGFGEEPFATVESLEARVKLLPLLSRRLEVGKVVVEGLVLNLARDEQLRGNWQDLLASAEDGPPRGAGAPAADGDGLAVEGVQVRGGTVNWSENRTDLRFVVSGIELETGSLSPGEPAEISLAFALLDAASQIRLETDSNVVADVREDRLLARDFVTAFRVVGPDGMDRASGDARFASVDYGFGGTAQVEGAAANVRVVNPEMWPDGFDIELAWDAASYDAQAQTMRFTALTTSARGVEAAWQIAAENLAAEPKLAGDVRVTAASAGNVFGLLSQPPPEGVDPAALGPLEVSAAFTASPNTLELGVTDLDARALGARVTGSAQVDANELRASVELPRFTPNDALYVLAEGYLPDTVDIRGLDALAFRTDVDADLDSGRATLRDLRAELLGGTVTGAVAFVPSASGTSVSGSMTTSRFAPDRLGRVVGGLLPANIDAQELGAVAIDTRFRYDAASDTAVLEPFAVQAFGLDGAGSATIAQTSTAPAASGNLRLQPFSPADLLRRLDQPVPQTSDPNAFREAAITTRFDVNENRGRFENLSVRIDETTITGSLTVSDFANPSYAFDLAADAVDVDRYVPPPAEEARAGERKAGDIELSADPLNAFRIDGRARVGKLKLSNLEFQEVATSLEIGGGKAALDGARAKLYGGTFDGGIHVDATGQLPTMTLRGRAAGLALEPVIVALTGDANFSGTGSFDIDLTGRGATITDNLQSAAGSMAFTLENGAIDGFNLAHVLCRAYNVVQRLPAPPDQPARTAYQLIQANATVQGGVATSPEVLARAAFMDVTGSGQLQLAEQTLDYNLRAQLTNSIEIQNCESMDRLIGGSIPFTIKGTVTDAEIRPDFSQIIQERVRDELEDRLRESLQDRLLDRLRN